MVNTIKAITCKKCGLPKDLCACAEEEKEKERMNMIFAGKYPLTEQEHLLQSPLCKRWQYTLSGWIRLIKCGPDGAELERQIQDRMWEDSEYATKIRAEFEEWLSEGKKWEGDFNATMWEEEEDDIRKSKRKSIREGGKYKSRGKEKRREP